MAWNSKKKCKEVAQVSKCFPVHCSFNGSLLREKWWHPIFAESSRGVYRRETLKERNEGERERIKGLYLIEVKKGGKVGKKRIVIQRN